jgi:phenylpyruvate tautomerase PptA (4-oxalocrotonate tautomerase family)
VPHLQFELNFSPPAAEKRAFAGTVVRLFSEIMDTGTDHIAVTVRTFAAEDLTFGRAAPSGGRTAFVNADIRLGRTLDQKRRLSLAYIGELATRFGLAPEAVYVILTEHDGHHFQLSDRVLPSWSAGEDPLAEPRERSARRRAAPKAGGRGARRRKRAAAGKRRA